MAPYTIYTQLVVDEARRRGITVKGYPRDNRNFVWLEYNGHREPVYMSMTDRYGQASHRAVFHKQLAMTLLREGGFPVPESIRTNQFAEAEAFLQSHGTIVVKPIGRMGGIGVSVGVRTSAGLRAAFPYAQRESVGRERMVVCQAFVVGDDHRVLVVNFEHVFAAWRVPAHVIGDGQRTVQQLVDEWNARTMEMRRIPLGEEASQVLAGQGLTIEAVPEAGRQVFLSRLANAHQGAIVHDVTDAIAPMVRTMARAIARHFACPFIGIDFISPDIHAEPGKIVELNPHAGIVMHHFPTYGQPRNVAGVLIDMLFPELAGRR